MTPIRRCLPLSLASACCLALVAGTGCSRLLPSRHGVATSTEIIIDTRQDPSESLSGRVIPEVAPAYTKWPVIFTGTIPAGAEFTDLTCETTQATGEPLAVLKPVVEENQVYLEAAVSKIESVSEVHVIVHAKYAYRW